MKSQITRKALVVRRNEGRDSCEPLSAEADQRWVREFKWAGSAGLNPHAPAALANYYAAAGTGCPQCEQRLAAAGMSLRHSGQGLVGGGGGGAAVNFILAIRVLTGNTTKK